MRLAFRFFPLAAIALTGCGFGRVAIDTTSLSAAQRTAVAGSVRSFMTTVAHDITQDGPTAWSRHFQDGPSFFMADNGQLVFPDKRSATLGTEAFARIIKHIELRWGDDLRVDPLSANLAVVAATYHEVQIDLADRQVLETGFFTAVAENRNGQWQFRDAHWSEPVHPAKAP